MLYVCIFGIPKKLDIDPITHLIAKLHLVILKECNWRSLSVFSRQWVVQYTYVFYVLFYVVHHYRNRTIAITVVASILNWFLLGPFPFCIFMFSWFPSFFGFYPFRILLVKCSCRGSHRLIVLKRDETDLFSQHCCCISCKTKNGDADEAQDNWIRGKMREQDEVHGNCVLYCGLCFPSVLLLGRRVAILKLPDYPIIIDNVMEFN